MNRFNTPLVAEGLIAYAIERQNGFERHQQKGFPPWAERRRLGTARRGFVSVPASPQLQQKTIRNLRRFVSALEFAGGDRRRQINVVWKLLDDMSSHLPWADTGNGLNRTRDEAEYVLCRMTAQLPIRFTRVLLGGDAGRDMPSAIGAVNACAFDLEILNRIGDRFLKEQGVQRVYSRQMTITASQATTNSWRSVQYPLLQGNRSLTAADFDVQERIGVEDDRVNFCLDVHRPGR